MRSQASGATVHVALIANDRSKHRAPNHASQEVYLQDYHLPDESSISGECTAKTNDRYSFVGVARRELWPIRSPLPVH